MLVCCWFTFPELCHPWVDTPCNFCEGGAWLWPRAREGEAVSRSRGRGARTTPRARPGPFPKAHYLLLHEADPGSPPLACGKKPTNPSAGTVGRLPPAPESERGEEDRSPLRHSSRAWLCFRCLCFSPFVLTVHLGVGESYHLHLPTRKLRHGAVCYRVTCPKSRS